MRNTLRSVRVRAADPVHAGHRGKAALIFAFAVLIAIGTAPRAGAVLLDDSVDTGILEQGLPEEAAELMDGIDPRSVPDSGVMERMFSAIGNKAADALTGILKTAGIMLTVCVMVSLANTLDIGGNALRYVILAGVAAVGASSMTDFDSYLDLGMNSLRSLREYSLVLLPVLSTAAAASGAAGAAAARYAATALFMNILLSAADTVIVPVVCGYSALSIADAAMGNQVLKTAKKLVKTVCTFLITAIAMAFTAWITLTGAVAETADALAVRFTKTAVSTALPVVGGIMADAAGTLAAAAGALRNSVGIYGMLAVVSVCVVPFIGLGGRYIAYKLSASVCSCVSDKRLSTLVEDLGTCFGLILAMNGAGALMLFIAIYSLIRTAV